jgi:hypothetical protein
VTVVVTFSPLGAIVKIFVLMGIACIATSVALLAAFREQPAPAQ